MKRVEKRRSAAFVEAIREPENEQEAEDLLMEYEEPEDRVRANLDAARQLCSSWQGDGQPGSDAMIQKIRAFEKFLRGELEVESRRDPWRIADYAMTLAKWWRDLETNEALHRPLDGKARSREALRRAQKEQVKNLRLMEIAKEIEGVTTKQKISGMCTDLGVRRIPKKEWEKRVCEELSLSRATYYRHRPNFSRIRSRNS